jgi:UDP-N-acetylmuramyl pentapeptide phosphotransferase/UDP-N-acetylglucosamine-1-phosphate transferase
MQTLQHIPVWVFALLLGLIALGLLQTRTRHVRAQRLLGTNIALTLFTLVGVTQQWRPTPWLALALLSWASACLLVTWALGQGAAPDGAGYDLATQRFTVPGSWLPLTLFMAIFACKFVVGMVNATAPESLHSVQAAIGISALYGLFSGVLNGRSWCLLNLKNVTGV